MQPDDRVGDADGAIVGCGVVAAVGAEWWVNLANELANTGYLFVDKMLHYLQVAIHLKQVIVAAVRLMTSDQQLVDSLPLLLLN